MTYNTANAIETLNLGKKMSGFLEPGDVIGFTGDLGAGKTTMIKGIIEGLGITDRVQSPSFVLIRTYQGKMEVKHVDLYRLDATGVYDLHLEEVYNTEGLMFIEWAERSQNLPGVVSQVSLHFIPNTAETREISVSGPLSERLS